MLGLVAKIIGGLIIGGAILDKGKDILDSDEVRNKDGLEKVSAGTKKAASDFNDYVEKEVEKKQKEIEKVAEKKIREREQNNK